MEKNRIDNGVKRFTLVIYIFLFLPLLFKFISFSERPLEGAFYNPPKPDFKIQTWFSGEFQGLAEAYFGSNFGLHNTLVRLRNTFDFSLFKKAHARYVVVGKDNYLFESEYIHSLYGRDFLGDKKVKDILQKLRCVQDSMAKKSQLLIPVIAAGKGSFYSEYIPDRFKGRKGKTNYDAFIAGFGDLKIDHIDFRDHFIKQKKTSPYPLYPKYGIHWSNYGSILVYDSLVKYISTRIPNSFQKLVIDSVEVSDSLRSPDDDILRTMNLFFPLKNEKMAYPRYHLEEGKTNGAKPDILVVSDSFWWYIYSTGLANNMFNNRFWFYNEEMYPESFKEPTYVKEDNYFKAIREADVIVILHTESTLYKFGNGFVDMLYETYCNRNIVKEEVQSLKGIIRADSVWLKQVKLKAQQRDISLDSMLTLDALYTIESKKKPRR